MFAKPGSQDTSGSAAATDAAAAAARAGAGTPEDRLTFRGVLREGAMLIAFVEDAGTGSTLRLKVGDTLGRGSVRELTLDQLVFDVGGKLMRAEIGQTLTGSTPAPSTRPAEASSSASSGDSPEEAAALERLRRRRQQEGGK
jgi:hypothetical protein